MSQMWLLVCPASHSQWESSPLETGLTALGRPTPLTHPGHLGKASADGWVPKPHRFTGSSRKYTN